MSYYVIDCDGCSVSWNENTERGERFSSKVDAIARAKEIAASEPGKTFEIAQAVTSVRCSINPASVLNL